MTREMFVPTGERPAHVNGAHCGERCFYRWGESRQQQWCYAFDAALLVRGGIKTGYCRCGGCKENQRLYGLGAEVDEATHG
jgi:hypothetical protein